MLFLICPESLDDGIHLAFPSLGVCCEGPDGGLFLGLGDELLLHHLLLFDDGLNLLLVGLGLADRIGHGSIDAVHGLGGILE